MSYHVNELRELEFNLDGDGVGDVLDGPDQLVVAGQDLVIQPLGVRVTPHHDWPLGAGEEDQKERDYELSHHFPFAAQALDVLLSSIQFNLKRLSLIVFSQS